MSYTCSVCTHEVSEARVWDTRAICRSCTFQPVGYCPVCFEEVQAVVTPTSDGRRHASVKHTCTGPLRPAGGEC